VRKDRMSCWEGQQRILAQEKKRECRGESRDEKMMMVKLIVQKEKKSRNGNKNRKPTITKQTKIPKKINCKK
jgi:hypothetical protein